MPASVDVSRETAIQDVTRLSADMTRSPQERGRCYLLLMTELGTFASRLVAGLNPPLQALRFRCH